MPLRDFQQDLHDRGTENVARLAYEHPIQKPNVVIQSATGTGKTVNMAHRAESHDGPNVAIAHRQELVSQISMKFAEFGIVHDIIGSKETRKTIERIHYDYIGRSFLRPNALTRVACVDTLIRRPAHDPWMLSVTLRQDDECHHVQKKNKWGRGVEMFPNATGYGYTAMAWRADGGGLGREASGVYDSLLLGPEMRRQIERGYLTDYRLIAAKTADLDLSSVLLSANGDYNQHQLSNAVHKSQIVGDVVEAYLKYAPGLLGITFAVDIEDATKIAAAFRAKGVPAEVVTSKTPDDLRVHIMAQFRARKILQLVNVDLFGEGVDVPGVQVVSMARPTQSLQLYGQQFGRALRLLLSKELSDRWGFFTDAERLWHISQSEKPCAIIIDHVDNWKVHGLPDARRASDFWTLQDRRRSGGDTTSDGIPLRVCIAWVASLGRPCGAHYERFRTACPECGDIPVPAGRSAPMQVDGDMVEIDPAYLEAMRRETEKVMTNAPHYPANASPVIVNSIYKNHVNRREAQRSLRDTIAQWAGERGHYDGLSTREQQKLFYLKFGMDVMAAQTLGATDAAALEQKLRAQMIVDYAVNNA